MQYLIIPLAIVVACLILGIYFLSQKSMTVILRMGLGVFFLLVSHGVVALGIYIYKEIDDNSYYAAAVGTLLEEINEALAAEEPGFEDRLQEFTKRQPLTYENRGNLLENAMKFQTDGKELRSKKN